MSLKVLAEEYKEQFKIDWEKLSYTAIKEKYSVNVGTFRRWARELECPFPKPRQSNHKRIITAKEVTPLTVVPKSTTTNIDTLPVEQVEEFRKCNEEFIRLNNDSTIPKRQKDELLCGLSLKIIGVYVAKAPDIRDFVIRAVDFFKLKQYEKRVNISEKESAEMDYATQKNLKKRYVGEAIDDICKELSEAETRMFEHLLQIASDRVMVRKAKLNEDIQNRALETSVEKPIDVTPVAQ